MIDYKYELVTDSTIIEIAKAMIDGEVFYSQLGENKYYWISGEFRSENVRGSSDIMNNWLTYCFYRKVECDWTDNLDGTEENSVLCWVKDYRDGVWYSLVNGDCEQFHAYYDSNEDSFCIPTFGRGDDVIPVDFAEDRFTITIVKSS